MIKGKHHSKKVKRKISQAQKGRNLGKTFEQIHGIKKAKEIKRKLSEINTGKQLSEKTKRKIKRANTGKIRSEESRIRLSLCKIGEKNPMKRLEVREKVRLKLIGKKHSKKTKRKMRLSHLGDKTKVWKGNQAGKSALHKWLNSVKSKPKLCEECHKKKKLELANIKNHNYTRNPKDYKWLCHKCHSKFDFPDGRVGKNKKKNGI
jgi:hypothetical protein